MGVQGKNSEKKKRKREQNESKSTPKKKRKISRRPLIIPFESHQFEHCTKTIDDVEVFMRRRGSRMELGLTSNHFRRKVYKMIKNNSDFVKNYVARSFPAHPETQNLAERLFVVEKLGNETSSARQQLARRAHDECSKRESRANDKSSFHFANLCGQMSKKNRSNSRHSCCCT